MKYNDCAIIADLLPSYIEGLTNDDTNIFIAEHLATCENCRNLLETSTAELYIPATAPSPKKGEKTIKTLRFRTLWFMFWPMLYGLFLQFKHPDPLRFFIIMLGAFGFVFITSHNAEYNFDPDDTKKAFYDRENKNIREGKGTFLTQGIGWLLPILLPVLFMVIPKMIQFFQQSTH